MRKAIIATVTFCVLVGMSIALAGTSSASVCEPNGAGCTQAGTYPGPNALINSDFGGFQVVWTESVVQPYSSGVPLYWTAYATYTNLESSTLSLSCPSQVDDLNADQEHMSGGSRDDGTVGASSTTCTDNPNWSAEVPAGGTAEVYTTFHNVPWPGSAVSLTWASAGTTAYVYPFQASSPAPSPSPSPTPSPSPSPKPSPHPSPRQLSPTACVFNAPTGGFTVSVDGEHISGHVGWSYLTDPQSGTWEYGANEGPVDLNPKHFNDFSRTWSSEGTWTDVLKAFAGPWPRSGTNKGYDHPGGYYATYRCVSIKTFHAGAALSIVKAQAGEVYSIPDFDCLAQAVQVLAAYGAPISEHAYLLNPYYWVPNHYYESGYMSKFDQAKRV
jgi:hypothetical protein